MNNTDKLNQAKASLDVLEYADKTAFAEYPQWILELIGSVIKLNREVSESCENHQKKRKNEIEMERADGYDRKIHCSYEYYYDKYPTYITECAEFQVITTVYDGDEIVPNLYCPVCGRRLWDTELGQ